MRDRHWYASIEWQCEHLGYSRRAAKELLRYLFAVKSTSPWGPTSTYPQPADPLAAVLRWILLNTAYRTGLEEFVGKITYHDRANRSLDNYQLLRCRLAGMNAISETGWEPDTKIWEHNLLAGLPEREAWMLTGLETFQLTPRLSDHDPFTMYCCGPLGYSHIWRRVSSDHWSCAKLTKAELRSRAREERSFYLRPVPVPPELRRLQAEGQETFQIFIKTLMGKTICVGVPFEEPLVEDVKSLIEEAEGIPPGQQRLIFANKQLVDDKCIYEYGITHSATLHLVLKLEGC